MKRFITIIAICASISLMGCSHGKCTDLGKKHCARNKLNTTECQQLLDKLERVSSGTCEAILYGMEHYSN